MSNTVDEILRKQKESEAEKRRCFSPMFAKFIAEIAVSGYTYSKLESMKEELQFLIDFIDTLETNAELKKD